MNQPTTPPSAPHTSVDCGIPALFMPRAGITYLRIVPKTRMSAAMAKTIHALVVPVSHAHTRIAPPTRGAEGQTWTTAPMTPRRITTPTIMVPRTLIASS